MKDLYTFDISQEASIETYHTVSEAYRAFFADLKLPMLVAEASSGDMGGNYSHEYHLSNPIGEDIVISCTSCGYTANDEVAETRPHQSSQHAHTCISVDDVRVWRGISKDRKTLVNAWYPAHVDKDTESEINIYAVRGAIDDLDASITDPVQSWKDAFMTEASSTSPPPRIINVFDTRLRPALAELKGKLPIVPATVSVVEQCDVSVSDVETSPSGGGLNLLRLMEGDSCPRCESGSLQIHLALELGHTFCLGSRYSEPLGLSITLPNSASPSFVEMGCYGIGVSRIFGAVAEHRADQKGLNWPRAIAPYEIAVIPTSGVNADILEFFDKLTSAGGSTQAFDAVLDDRKETFGWKMQDADVTGYPVTIILGKPWREKGICEVQCRALGSKENIAVEDLPAHLNGLLARL